jgi:hypothetical protein
MKKISLILVAISLFVFSNANAQKKYLAVSETPGQIISYINAHFPKSEIISVKKDKEVLKTEYKVKLNTMVELEFDGNFSIKKIESKSALPQSVVPEKIVAYIHKNYPNNKILEWKKEKKGQKIELDNDIDVVFDLNGKFLGIDR